MNKALKRTLSTLKSSISLVLSFSIMLSVAAISGVSLNAASGGSRFSHGDYIYVSKADAQGANFGDVICHMYKAWPDADGSYIDSIVMQKINNNYYRCFMLADNVRYVKFKLTNGGDWWIKKNGNPVFSVNYDDHDNNPSNGNNCLYVKDNGANSCDWGPINSNDPDYNPSVRKGTFYEKTATLGSTLTNREDLTLVKGTFYDYYNNDEIRNGWTNLDGSERKYTDREPFTIFNNAIAQYSRNNNSWSYPLYFGDFNRSGKDAFGPGPWYDYYKGAGISDFNKYLARANNSNMTSSGVYGTVSGLVDTTLKGGMTGTVTKDGVVLPYFDKNFISQGYGSIVNSQFPFRQENKNGDTYHIYESLNAKDNFYFTNLKGSPVANYYNYSNGITDAAAGFGNPSNGKGFFPFDNGGTEAKNFGFGMKLEIPFSLNNKRTTENGNDVIFKFSGDDDLWIYVDGRLVLDMGGAHKMASGTINFTKQTVSVNAVDGSYGNPSIGNITNVDGGEDHVMTVFYMERGMIESNLAIEYNFSPLDNLLTTEKVVNTEKVNAGLKDATAQLDSFTVTNSSKTGSSSTYAPLANKDYIHLNENAKGKSDANGSYKIKDGQKVAFSNIVSTNKNSSGPKVGDYLKVTESFLNTYLSYSTTYRVTDEDNSSYLVKEGSGTNPEFRFINTNGTSTTADDSVNNYAYYNVKFVNTPDIGDITVSKKVQDSKGNDIDTDKKSFSFKIGIDLKGGADYKYYNLVSTSSVTATGGSFTLKDNQSITFKGIPANASYIVTETADSDYVTSSNNASGKVIKNANMSVEYVNQQINKDDATVVFEGNKVIDKGKFGKAEAETFYFDVYEYKLNSSGKLVLADNVVDATGTNNADGTIKFGTIKYPYVAPPTEPETTTKPTPTTNPTTKPTTKPTTEPTTKPDDTFYLYLKPSNNWKSDNARFATYFFQDGKSPMWLSMESYGSGYYRVKVPDGYNKVIFARMNPNTSTNSFDNGVRWNQTADLSVPSKSSSNICYAINEQSGWTDNGYWTSMSMSSHEAAYLEIEPIEKDSENVMASSNKEYYIYAITERVPASSETYFYDNTVYYVVVELDRSNMKTTPYYFNSEQHAIDAVRYKYFAHAINPSEVVFNNYHKASLTIKKFDANGTKINSDVFFSLYKVSGKDGALIEENLVGTKEVSGGEVVFDELAIYTDDNMSEDFQWYCFKEYKAKDGLVLDTTKTYIRYPALITAGVGDVVVETIDDVNYTYAYKNEKLVFDAEYSVNNYSIVTPLTSGEGRNNYFKTGTIIILSASMLAASYFVYGNIKRRKRCKKALLHLRTK